MDYTKFNSSSIELILNVEENKNNIKNMIAVMINKTSKHIKKIRLTFRKYLRGVTSGVEGTKAYFEQIKLQREQIKKLGQEKRLFTRYHIKKHPYKPRSKEIKWSRHLFINAEDLKSKLIENHHKQQLRYWLNIEFGYILRNIETSETTKFYPSYNTSFFDVNKLPMINTSIDEVLGELTNDNIIEKLKRPNSKWVIQRIYEYIVLTTPIPDTPIGSSINLPDFIKNSKSIISFEHVLNNMCFWYCLAHFNNPTVRLDRLAKCSKPCLRTIIRSNLRNNIKELIWKI